MSTQEFIEKAKKIHGDKYDYSKTEYGKNNKEKVCIICPEHGEFWQMPTHHLSGRGCRKCQYKAFSNDRKITFDEWAKKANEKHKCKYVYDKVDLKNRSEDGKVCIICPEHGEFWQLPNAHVYGKGCPKCGRIQANNSESLTDDKFTERAIQVHGNKYDYSLSKYNGWLEKIDIICKKHGIFKQTAGDHLHGAGCPECKKEILHNIYSLSTDEFIEKATQVHGDKYDYSKLKYINGRTKVCIVCKIHGEFWQQPGHHLNGAGCPLCRESRMELEISLFLKNKGIYFIRQYRPKWIGKLSLDFYLTDYNIAIECQGQQHFEIVEHFGGLEKFEKTIERDKRKKELCEQNNVKLLYFANKKYNDEIITDKNNLLEEILKYAT